MDENFLIKLSLIATLFGIGLLIFVSDKIKVKEYKIEEINETQLDQDIRVVGKIVSIKETSKLLILTLKNKKEIKAALLKEDKIEFKKGMMVEVIGKLETFEKEFQIEARQVRAL